MDKHSILVDGTQLLQRRGTGIASYTRSLTRCLHSLGADVNLFFGANTSQRKGDPSFSLATQIFGNRPSSPRFVQQALAAIRTGFGFKRSIEAVEVDLQSIDLAFLDPPLPPCKGILNADAALTRASVVLSYRSLLTTVRCPGKVSAAHWTGPVALKASGAPNLYTIHDLIPLQFPYMVIDRPGRSARVHAAIAREADGIITVSETSKAGIVDILRVPPERVTVTYQPVPHLVSVSRDTAEWIVSNIYNARPYDYALFVGAIEPKKNVRRLIEAFLLARLSIPLLIAGPFGWLYEAENEILEIVAQRYASEIFVGKVAQQVSLLTGSERQVPSQSLQRDLPVRQVGYVPRNHLTALLQCAKFFVFPSIYEGFGLPALEAMQLGIPVLTSRTGSLCEVVGDNAVFCDPANVDNIAQGIRELDANGDLRSHLAKAGPIRAAKFSDEAFAHRVTEAYRKVGVSFANQPVHMATEVELPV